MCLGVPGRITKIWNEEGKICAQADFIGETRPVCLNYLPDLAVGDYIIVHAGFALTRLDVGEASRTIEMMREYGVIDADAPALPLSSTG